MKTYRMLFAAALALPLMLSCNKETAPREETPLPGKNLLTLTAAPAEAAADTRTAFVDGTFMWKQGNNINVRSDNSNGYTLFTYTGDDTAGPAEFTIKKESASDKIVTGTESFAVYPGTGARVEDGTLKINLKTGYTWFDGNVEAPMLAQVTDDGTNLQFKHIGGLLKVTYKYLPPKAAKLVIWAPCSDEGMQSYKICSTMKETFGWEETAGGFTGETPYVQAYPHSGKYEITQTITDATAAQKASEDGVTVYIPLPVGPGETHSYPELKIRLTFADGTTVPGSERTARNIKIERAVIKEMRPIALTKYTSELFLGTTQQNTVANKVDGGKGVATFGAVRGLVFLNNNYLVAMDQAESLRIINLSDAANPVIERTYNNTGSQALPYYAGTPTQTLQTSAAFNVPWDGCVYDGKLWIADKGNARLLYVTYNEDGTMSQVNLGRGFWGFEGNGNRSPMSVCFDASGNAYIPVRDNKKIYKMTAGFTQSTAPVVFADFTSENAQPDHCIFDGDGNLIVSCNTPAKMYLVKPDGTISQIAGTGTAAGSFSALVDGLAINATVSNGAMGMAFDSDGALWITNKYWLRKMTKGENGWEDAVITTVVGGEGNTIVEGVGAMASFSDLYHIAVRPNNSKELYVSNTSGGKLLKVTIE